MSEKIQKLKCDKKDEKRYKNMLQKWNGLRFGPILAGGATIVWDSLRKMQLYIFVNTLVKNCQLL